VQYSDIKNNLMKLTSKLSMAVALCATLACCKPQEKEVLPIMAWYSIPAEYATLERYQELADCGFNINFSHLYNFEDLQKALDFGEQTGVKIMATCNGLKTDTENTVNAIKDHPALFGYFLRDEPLTKDFPELAEWAQRVKDADNTHMIYLNLFPSYVSAEALGCSYREHTHRFIEEVKLPMVSFDNYPVTTEGVRQLWYENLEIIADESAKAGLPFWAFSLSTPHVIYPMPTLASMRLQQYTNLAYGAQGLQYFTYWTPTPNEMWDFHSAPIEVDGTRTPVYDLVKQLNKELQARAGVFVNSKVLAVRHTGKNIPPQTTPLTELPEHVTALETFMNDVEEPEANPADTASILENGEEYDPVKAAAALPFLPAKQSDGAVVSVLEKGDYQYLMLVNRSMANTLSLKVSFDEKVCMIDREGKAVKVSRDLTGYTIEEGDCIIFRYKK